MKFDYTYRYRPDWVPEGCDIRPWFLTEPIEGRSSDPFFYRTEKLDFVRNLLSGADRNKMISDILGHIFKGTSSDVERFEKIIFFVQDMMIHPPCEQPMEKDARSVFRGLKGVDLAVHAPPYPEDLSAPWLVQANLEAEEYGVRQGVWCNPLSVEMDGDWGMAGMVTDASELLLLHEGRCGHQACVVVQLAQAAGFRARLVQLFHHRVAEILIEDEWLLADPDEQPRGFIGKDENDRYPSIKWCMRNIHELSKWPLRPEFESFFEDKPQKYGWHFTLPDDF